MSARDFQNISVLCALLNALKFLLESLWLIIQNSTFLGDQTEEVSLQNKKNNFGQSETTHAY